MDDSVLRIVLITVGIMVMVGIYLWDRYRRRAENASRRQRGALEPGLNAGGPPLSGDRSASRGLTGERDLLGKASTDEAQITAQRSPVSRSRGLQRRAVSGGQGARPGGEPLRPPAPPKAASVPPRIMQVSVVAAPEGTFGGREIQGTLRSLGLFHGEMQIFHRHEDDDPQGAVIFSVASMVEPGTIPADELEDFSTPGLTFFLRLPGCEKGIEMFDNMIFSAERTARSLGGELQDAHHSTLTRQTIGHLREEVLEHCRRSRVDRQRQ